MGVGGGVVEFGALMKTWFLGFDWEGWLMGKRKEKWNGGRFDQGAGFSISFLLNPPPFFSFHALLALDSFCHSVIQMQRNHQIINIINLLIFPIQTFSSQNPSRLIITRIRILPFRAIFPNIPRILYIAIFED